MRYYIGLDNGGTTTKAALFDEKGRELGKALVAGIWAKCIILGGAKPLGKAVTKAVED